MSQEAGNEDTITNNNSGHIVVDNAVNNNVAGASHYNRESDGNEEDSK